MRCSDVYAMGGTPILALAIVGMPIKVLPGETIREILRGGETICAQAGIPLAGGHSIDSVEPIYGLVALGVVHPDSVKRNADARAGDVLVLGKPLGVGIYSAALEEGRARVDRLQSMVATTTQLNVAGPELAELPGVHAMTDVTGFGLLGHLLEVCRGSGFARASADVAVAVPGDVVALARSGIHHGRLGTQLGVLWRRRAAGRGPRRGRSRHSCATRRPRAACSCPAPPTPSTEYWKRSGARDSSGGASSAA